MTIDQWPGLDAVDNEVIEYGLMIARAIRRRRESAGLTREEFATRIGCTPTAVAKAEHGQVGIGRMLAIYFATGVKAADLARIGD